MINLNIINCLEIHVYDEGRSEEWMKWVNEIKEWMKAKSYFWTFPTVKLDKYMFLRILLKIPSLEFMYNHWFSVIQLVSIEKEKYLPHILKHLALLGVYSSKFLIQISLINLHSYTYEDHEEKLSLPCGCRPWRKFSLFCFM